MPSETKIRRQGKPKRLLGVRCPYLYIEKPLISTGLAKIRFFYSEGDHSHPEHYRVYFQTDVAILPEHWDAKRRLVLPECEQADVLNKRLEELHDFAVSAVAERKTQDEVRALLDLRNTRLVVPYSVPNRNCTSGLMNTTDTNTSAAEETAADPAAQPVNSGLSDEQMEAWHQASSRGSILYNELLALRTEHNSLLAAVVAESPDVRARIFNGALNIASAGIGNQLRQLQGPSHAEHLWKTR